MSKHLDRAARVAVSVLAGFLSASVIMIVISGYILRIEKPLMNFPDNPITNYYFWILLVLTIAFAFPVYRKIIPYIQK